MRFLNSTRKPSKHSLSAVLLTVISLASCGVDIQPSPTAETTHASSLDKEKAPAAHSLTSATTTDAAYKHERTLKLEQYLCPNGACLSDDQVLTASSLEEADWLLRNGYPSPSEQQRLQGLSVEALEEEAKRSSPARLELAQRYADAGDTDYAMSLAVQVADSGSIYAYHRMSHIMSAGSSNQDLIDSAAYFRVAYLLGDHRASKALALAFPEFGPVEDVIIDRRAAGLYSTMARNKAPEPRPYSSN